MLSVLFISWIEFLVISIMKCVWNVWFLSLKFIFSSSVMFYLSLFGWNMLLNDMFVLSSFGGKNMGLWLSLLRIDVMYVFISMLVMLNMSLFGVVILLYMLLLNVWLMIDMSCVMFVVWYSMIVLFLMLEWKFWCMVVMLLWMFVILCSVLFVLVVFMMCMCGIDSLMKCLSSNVSCVVVWFIVRLVIFCNVLCCFVVNIDLGI